MSTSQEVTVARGLCLTVHSYSLIPIRLVVGTTKVTVRVWMPGSGRPSVLLLFYPLEDPRKFR